MESAATLHKGGEPGPSWCIIIAELGIVLRLGALLPLEAGGRGVDVDDDVGPGMGAGVVDSRRLSSCVRARLSLRQREGGDATLDGEGWSSARRDPPP